MVMSCCSACYEKFRTCANEDALYSYWKDEAFVGNSTAVDEKQWQDVLKKLRAKGVSEDSILRASECKCICHVNGISVRH
jgi:hypothetical protein